MIRVWTRTRTRVLLVFHRLELNRDGHTKLFAQAASSVRYCFLIGRYALPQERLVAHSCREAFDWDMFRRHKYRMCMATSRRSSRRTQVVRDYP